MRFSLFIYFLFLTVSLWGSAQNGDTLINAAPFYVEQQFEPQIRPDKTTLMGPFIEKRMEPSETISALRPFIVDFKITRTKRSHIHSLYPFFSYYEREDGYDWNSFQLIRGAKYGTNLSQFEIWPLLWHYDTGNDENSYDALFPVYGTLKNRLFYKRIHWILFPLYSEFETQSHTDYCLVWPVVRARTGEHEKGLGLWPFFGRFEGENQYKNWYALWPFIFHNQSKLDQEIPTDEWGILPFYTQKTGEGLISKNYLWPFFGYTKEWAPRATYKEHRYLWPLWVQGRGEKKYLNQWYPFYSFQKSESQSKRWILWPFYKHKNWQEERMSFERDQILYWLWFDEKQRVESQDFEARVTHFWPFFSYRNDGEGHRQFQTISPFAPFFPNNETIRETWNPFFALYRYDRRDNDCIHSVLWDLIYVRRAPERLSYQIGPLFQYESNSEEKGWNLLYGLLGYHKTAEKKSFRLFWLTL